MPAPLMEIQCICVFPKTQRPPASAVHYRLSSVLLGVVLRWMPYDMVHSCENSINREYILRVVSSTLKGKGIRFAWNTTVNAFLTVIRYCWSMVAPKQTQKVYLVYRSFVMVCNTDYGRPMKPSLLYGVTSNSTAKNFVTNIYRNYL